VDDFVGHFADKKVPDTGSAFSAHHDRPEIMLTSILCNGFCPA